MSANIVHPDIMLEEEVVMRAQVVLITLLQEHLRPLNASLAPLESMRPVEAQHVLCARLVGTHQVIIKAHALSPTLALV